MTQVNPAQMQWLQAQWAQMMAAMDLPAGLDCFQALLKAYAEPHRHYHTLSHILAMLTHLDAVKSIVRLDRVDEANEKRQPDGIADIPPLGNVYELALAIWFHDAIYKPFSNTNEADSAAWAERFLREHGYPDVGIARVHRLIMVTEHGVDLDTDDEKLMVDIDLSILATAPEVYDVFEVNIRKEYRKVPGFVFRKKRKALLQMFLDQQRIYHTDYFFSQLEQRARENLHRAIMNLK